MSEMLYADGQREVRAVRIHSAPGLEDLPAAPYAALVWSSVAQHPSEDIQAICDRLFATGCRYVVAGGLDCERWHDTADERFLALYPTDAERDANFVMTTWHTDESEQEVVFFFLMNTRSYGDHLPYARFVLVEVGEDEGAARRLREAVARFAGRYDEGSC